MLKKSFVVAFASLSLILHQNGVEASQQEQCATIELAGPDNKKFAIPLEIAQQSQTLGDLLIGMGQEAATKSISLRDIDNSLLQTMKLVMWSAYTHRAKRGRIFLNDWSKDAKLPDILVLPLAIAFNLLMYKQGIKLIAYHLTKYPHLIPQIIPMMRNEQLSSDTAKELSRIFFLVTRKDLPIINRKEVGFSMLDYSEYQSDTLNERIRDLLVCNLGGMRLESIDGIRDFPQFSALKQLILCDNHLTELPEMFFQGLNCLEKLSLSNNRFTWLPEMIFRSLINLAELRLSRNHLRQLPISLFSGLHSLMILALDENELTQLPPTAFHDLNSLKALWLGKNRLADVPETLLSGLNGLKDVWLDVNQLRYVPVSLFQGLPHLKQVSLDFNQLTEENKEALRNALPNVRIHFT